MIDTLFAPTAAELLLGYLKAEDRRWLQSSILSQLTSDEGEEISALLVDYMESGYICPPMQTRLINYYLTFIERIRPINYII